MADSMLRAAGAETAYHSREVERIALRIADQLGMNGDERQNVGITARLHDIGKVALPPALLQKTTQPTATEWRLIRNHTIIGERILRSVDELREIAPWVRASHERWDGDGYPDGLSGPEIPLVSRIVFCADAFDAICTDRPYSAGRSMGAALAEMRRCAGTQFEPRVVAALAEVVRDEIYGSIRMRRRSHARLSMLLVVAATLGGSIAGGIASGRDASSLGSILSPAPLVAPVAPAPAPEAAEAQLAPRLLPRAGVAEASEASRPSPAESAPKPDQPRPDPAPPEQRPAPPVTPPSVIGSVTGPVSEIGSGLRPSSDPAKDDGLPDRDGTLESGVIPVAPAQDSEERLGLDVTRPLTY